MRKLSAVSFQLSAQATRTVWLLCFSIWLIAGSRQLIAAERFPSVFRGVVVADAQPGARVVSVEEHSQAYLSELRPEDVILSINDQPVRSIDEFATLSQQLKGQAKAARVLVLRDGKPLQLTIHLYSLPLRQQWDVSFVYAHEIRFVDPTAALDYWGRLGRGFEDAGNLEQALYAYLNGLHNDPANLELATKASELFWQVARRRIDERAYPQAVRVLQQGTRMLRRLFDHQLTPEQLAVLKVQLEQTVETLRHIKPLDKT